MAASSKETVLVPNGVVSRAAQMATAAGVLWIVHYALQLVYGVATGKVLLDATGRLWWRLDVLIFFGAYITTGLALWDLARLLVSRWKARIAAAFAAFGCVAGAFGALCGVLFPLLGTPWMIAGKCILALFVAAIVAGIGGLRSPAVPRQTAVCVLLFGLLTMPLAMLFGMWENRVPAYTVMEVHFVLSGIVWLIAGKRLRGTAGALSGTR